MLRGIRPVGAPKKAPQLPHAIKHSQQHAGADVVQTVGPVKLIGARKALTRNFAKWR